MHIGRHDYDLCQDFMKLLEKEGYKCCSNLDVDPTDDEAVGFLINISRNYIIWISSIDVIDKWLGLFDGMVERSAVQRHGYFAPYIFRLNKCSPSLYLLKYAKYETYELSTDLPFKMAEILEYLKRSPTKGISYLFLANYISFNLGNIISITLCLHCCITCLISFNFFFRIF